MNNSTNFQPLQYCYIRPLRLADLPYGYLVEPATIIFKTVMGLSIKYVTLFWPILTHSPLSHFVTHPGTPKSTSHISDPPIFSRPSRPIKNPDKSPLYKFSLNCSWGFLYGGFCQRGLLSGMFCPGWFLSIPPSVRIHLLQQKGKHHFKFHVSYV